MLHPPPESLEIQNVLLYYDVNSVCPIEAILKFSQEDCTRLEGSTLVNLLAVTKQLFTVLTKFVGNKIYNWSFSVRWSTKCNLFFICSSF